MPFAQIGIPGLILLVIVALIIFGPKKLPEIGKAAGQTLKEFKDSTNELVSENEEKDSKDEDTSDSADVSDTTDKADEKRDTEKTS